MSVRTLILCLLLAVPSTAASAADSEQDALITKVLRVAIVTRDYEASTIFYRDILGLVPRFEGEISHVGARTLMGLSEDAEVWFGIFESPANEGAMIGLLRIDRPELPAQATATAPMMRGEPMLAIEVSNIDEVWHAVRHNDIEVLVQPLEVADGDFEFVIRDPNGVRLHIVGPPGWTE